MVYYTHKTYKNWNCFRKLILQLIELNELNVKIKFSLEIRIFCKCSWALRHHHAALKLKRIPVLSYFTPHDPTIRNSTMHDSNINYPNQFKLCRKNYKHYATRTIFYLTKERELLLHVNKCLSTSRGVQRVFYLIKICIATESLDFIVFQLFT